MHRTEGAHAHAELPSRSPDSLAGAQRSFPGAFRRPSVARRGLTGKLPCSLSRHESELRASLIFRRTVPSRKVLLQPRAAAASAGRDEQHGGTTIMEHQHGPAGAQEDEHGTPCELHA